MSAKTKLNNIEILIPKASIDSCQSIFGYISHDECFLVNDVLREYDDLKEAIKNLKDFKRHLDLATRLFNKDFNLFIKQCYDII